jgi:MATE family multidrug resistance protein
MAGEPTLSLQKTTAGEATLKYILKLAWPIVITNISFTIMQFVNRLMVADLGTEALAAVLPAGIISTIPASFAMGIVTSVTTFVSQNLGRGDKKDCSNYCWQAMYMGIVYSVTVAAIMWPAAPWIFKVLGHEPAVAELEVIYLRIMLYTIIPVISVWACSQFFMGIHRPIITMYAALVAQVVNIVFNYLLIFGKFGFPKMGIAGAGWGSFIGVMVGATIRMVVFLGDKINAGFSSRQTTYIDLKKMKDLLKLGLPSGMGVLVNTSFWGMILFALVGKFGKEALAATSAVFSYTNLAIMPIVGIGIALTAAAGKAIGQDRKDIAVKQTDLCLKISLVYMVLVGLYFFAFKESLMTFFSTDDMVIKTGTNILICAAIFQIFDAAAIIYSSALRGAGDTMWPAAASAIGTIVILGLGGLFMVRFFPQLGAVGPWIADTISGILVGLAILWRFKSNGWMKIDLFKRRPAAMPIEIETVID